VRSPLVTSASCPSLHGPHAKIIPASLMGHNGTYCYTPNADASKNGSPAEFLDAIPARILCVALDSSGGGVATGGGSSAPTP
jgi:hypothetical protein